MDLESRGVPSVFVASTEFAAATVAQAKALSVDPAVVFVPHPIQDRTDAEMIALADAAIEPIIQAVSQA